MSKDIGMITEEMYHDNISGQEDCVSEGTTWWLNAGIAAEGDSEQEWNEIEDNGSNIWRFFTQFDSDFLPKNATAYSCPSNGTATPENFEFHIESQEDPSNLYFSSERPQEGDSESENKEIGLLLEILGGYGGAYTAAGSALVSYLMEDSETVSVNYSNYDSEVNFDVPLDYSGSLPQDGDETVAEVGLRVNNEFSDGFRSIEFLPKYTFGHLRTPTTGDLCYCEYNYTDYVTTVPDSPLVGDYKAVE